MKKKLLTAVLSVSMIFGLAACGTGSATETTAASTSTTASTTGSEETEARTTAGDAETTTEGGKSLVVYYSASGITEGVAHTLAELTDADLFELVPVEPYSDADLNWRDTSSRVSLEHDDPSLRVVELTSTTVENWEEYDTVYIGYPIWWAIAAWPVDQFIVDNDFTGKTVVPFCTAATSGIGQSGQLLEEAAGSGTWLEGDRFRSNTTAADLETWLRRIGIME